MPLDSYNFIKRSCNHYFTVEKVSGSSEKLRELPKITQHVTGKDRIRTQVFQNAEGLFLLLDTLLKSQEKYSCCLLWPEEEDKAALGNQAHQDLAQLLSILKAFCGC